MKAHTGAQPISSAWVKARLAAELASDGAFAESWKVAATATPVDSPADGTCASDADGVLPDYYDIDVVVTPSGSTATRFAALKPFTLSFQVDFANRTAGGILTIQACRIRPQVDERLPIGACVNSGSRMAVLPPAGSRYSGGDISCVVEPLDCRSFECASPTLDGDCGGHGNADYVSVWAEPASDWSYDLVGDPSDPVTKGYGVYGKPLDGTGSASIPYLKAGRYKVTIHHGGNYVPWTSHSVPADGWATVVSGVESRVVQMFKPAPRSQSIVIPITTTDVSRPPWDGRPEYDELYKKGPYELILVPIPRGRTLAEKNGVIVKDGDANVVFDDLEPGLYAAYMADPDLKYEYELSGTAGFIFVPPGGGAPIMMPSSTDPEWNLTFCDPDVRDAYSPGTHTHWYPGATEPAKWVWEPCASPSGGPPAPGGGGSGGT
jgi:hypothetical protein